MPRINWKRVVIGGLAAGAVVNLCEFLVSGVLLRADWEKAMLALNRPLMTSVSQIAALQFWGFLMGFGSVLLYVHLRDRYNPGWQTACLSGFAIWVVGYLSGSVTGAAMGMFPLALAVDSTLMGLVEILLASLTGAFIYQPVSK